MLSSVDSMLMLMFYVDVDADWYKFFSEGNLENLIVTVEQLSQGI